MTSKVVDEKIISSSPPKTNSDGSDSSSAEEDRLRRLFESCDGDGDGFIDGDDFFSMCGKLNMEESAEEIMHQMGMNQTSRITFDDFIRYRTRVLTEIEGQGYMDDTGIESDTGVHLPHNPNMCSWPTMSSENSLGANSGKPDSLDYDSGARDMSPEPPSFQKLIESHDPSGFHTLQASYSGSDNFLELANRLHLAALTSLKGEIIDLTNRLQHVTNERDLLEKQLTKSQTDKLCIQRECEDRVEQTVARYEERITELHSVIAELRKKIERHHINVIREEDEYEDSDAGASAKSDQDLASINENNANGSQSASLDMGNDLNSEFSRVVADLENVIDHHRRLPVEEPHYENYDNQFIEENEDGVENKTVQVCRQMEKLQFTPPPPPTSPPPPLNSEEEDAMYHHPHDPPESSPLYPQSSPVYPQASSPLNDRLAGTDIEMSRYLLVPEIDQLRGDNAALQETIVRQEAELNKIRTALCATREDREKLKKRVRDLQGRLSGLETTPSPQNSRTSTPTKAQLVQPNTGDRPSCNFENFPIAKIAELKKLRTSANDRQVLGSEISTFGLPNAKLAEHLAQSLQECSNMQEIIQTLYKCGSEISESNVKEFEIETERLSSKIDHLKSQNDLLQVTLDESRAHTDRLSVLIGKYESNNTALQLAINYSDQALEAFEVVMALLESEQGVLLANCRAAGLGSYGEGDDQQEIASILQRANHSRKSAENVAKHLLQRLDRSCGINVHIPACTAQPWEDLSSNGRTGSTTSSTASSGDMEFGKVDEQRLRDYIQQLKNDRVSVKMTVLELESVHVDPLSREPCGSPDSQRLDLENAVLMQELMAMKEEKAELKAQNYLLDKEKRALELRLSGKESQEQAYRVQIDHLKCEVEQQQETKRRGDSRTKKDDDPMKVAMMIAEQHSHNATEIAGDLSESWKREKKLKQRVQELVTTLEKLSRNSERRHQESAEFVNDLKRANSALISAFEKAKKKYQSKLKKLETQMTALTERYETQMSLLKQRVAVLEEEASRLPANETSL